MSTYFNWFRTYTGKRKKKPLSGTFAASVRGKQSKIEITFQAEFGEKIQFDLEGEDASNFIRQVELLKS